MHIGDFTGPAIYSVVALTASATSQIVARGDNTRLGMTFFNHGTGAFFLKLGDAASVTSFTVKLSSGSYYELPLPIHTGTITGIHDSAVGHVMVTTISRP